MAEEHKEQVASVHEGVGEGEVKDRGLFDFLGKKSAEENKPEEDYLSAGVQNFHIEEGYKLQGGKEKEEEKPSYGFFEKEEVKPSYGVFEKEKEKKEEDKHDGLLHKLHRSHSSSSSSSSSDEFEADGGIKEKIKKKKQGLKEKIQGKEEHHDEENKKPPFVSVPTVEEPVVVVEELELQEPIVPEESKKGFLEKIKDKLPGHSKKPTEEGGAAAPPVVHEAAEVTEGKEKKGFLEKIIEKLPGHHHKSTGEEADNTPASN